jgi:hypothetical protein
MKNIDDLRDALFSTLQGVRDGTIDVDQARVINALGKTLTDTARVAVDYLQLAGGGQSSFISAPIGDSKLPPGITGVVTHRLRG